MSWIVETPLSWFQKFCIRVLKCGLIPRHVAIIMDGNRRYASKMHMERVDGHSKGFDKLAESLQWCLELGIYEVTVYAFSIENFKRTEDEVNALMKLACEKFRKLLEEKDKLMSEGVCIRIIGNLSLLSPEMRKLTAEAVLMTKNNTRAFLNVAFAYTSSDEISNAVQTIVEGLNDEQLSPNDLDEDLLSGCMYTYLSPDPDLIIRTSGEVRFSDFLLWQISDASICFADVLWPELNLWHFLFCIFKYQRNCTKQKEICCKQEIPYLEKLHENRIKLLKSYM